MKVTINNEEYCVSWRHNNNIGVLNASNKPLKSSTSCTITITGGGFLTGASILHSKDTNYDRKKGIKESCKRAISLITVREIRTELWKAYWDRLKQPVQEMEVTEDQMSILNTLADITIDGEDKIYTINKLKFKAKLKQL